MNLSVKDLTYINGLPPFSADFEHVNVIMGANGSGKSKLLGVIASNLVGTGHAYKPVLVEGGRTTEFKTNVRVDQQSWHIYNNPKGLEEGYISNRSSTLNMRMRTTLLILKALEQSRKAEHSDLVQLWCDGGKSGDCPARPEMPFTFRLAELSARGRSLEALSVRRTVKNL
jgi:energy-coupling factor transporter ATP-binding protein EcfA2